MKKFINILGAAAIVLGGVTSCTLDAVNYVEKTPENFPVTSDDASQALAGIYQNLSLVCANPQMSFLYLSMLASHHLLDQYVEGRYRKGCSRG